AKDKFGITTFVLDDGFQHRRAKRDLDIVCIDATDPFGGGRTLPAGNLREPLRNLARASAVVLSRTNLVDSTEELIRSVQERNLDALIFKAEFRIVEFRSLDKPESRFEPDPNTKSFAFCAVGNPDSFRRTLEMAGVQLAGSRFFPDHHLFSGGDIDAIEQEAMSTGANCLMTTAKDSVRLQGKRFTLPCYTAVAELSIEDREAFRKLITSS
ncbi:MAG: tetraacyldisaccharide 4'-kinase, partial [Pyrinomonadaceae bacterium]